MQAIIESFSDFKMTDRGPSAKIKTEAGEFIYINEDPKALVGRTIDIDVNEKTSKAGNRYKVGKITKVYEATAANSNGNSNGKDDTWSNNSGKKVPWDDYRAMAEAAHELAVKLEPDGSGMQATKYDVLDGDIETRAAVTIDRSTARAAILNTVMIAYSNGKISVPADEDDIPPF